MIKNLFIFVSFVVFYFVFTLAYCDSPVSFELRFICEKSSTDCVKMVNTETQKEMFVQKQKLFSLVDLKKVSARVLGSNWDNGKSLMSPNKPLEPNAKIILSFTDKAAKRLYQATANHVNKRLGVIFDGKLMMAPNISEPLTSGEIEIAGNISKSSAENIANRINKALGVKTQEPSAVPFWRAHIGLIAVVFGLLVWVAFKLRVVGG